MRPPVSLRQRLWIGGLASGGVVAGHALAFTLVAPHPAQRQALLSETGHGAWPLLVPMAMGALVAGLAGFTVGQLRDERPLPPAARLRGAAGRLVPLQLAAYLLLEALERLASGHQLSELPGEPVIAIGLATQALVALAGAVLLTLFARFVDRLGRLFRQDLRAPRLLVVPGAPAIALARRRPARGPASPRGPPPSAS
ncbi:MAG: hypothetical protein ACRDZ0_03970 [Acidimicrobiales bacterium]